MYQHSLRVVGHVAVLFHLSKDICSTYGTKLGVEIRNKNTIPSIFKRFSGSCWTWLSCLCSSLLLLSLDSCCVAASSNDFGIRK